MAARRVVWIFGLQRVDHVGIGDRVRDLGRAVGVERLEIDVDGVGEAHALDRQTAFEGPERSLREPEIWRGRTGRFLRRRSEAKFTDVGDVPVMKPEMVPNSPAAAR